MLELYRKRFNDILEMRSVRKKSVMLASLMTEVESYYKISMHPSIFYRETDERVRDLYVQISQARVMHYPRMKTL